MEVQKIRYDYLDVIRGLALTSMVFYHGMWDLVYIAGVNIPWFSGSLGYVWQQSICRTFILLSGFCFSLSRQKWKRGSITFMCGLIITIVTLAITPQERVIFGILTFLGSSALILAALDIFISYGIFFVLAFEAQLSRGVNDTTGGILEKIAVLYVWKKFPVDLYAASACSVWSNCWNWETLVDIMEDR